MLDPWVAGPNGYTSALLTPWAAQGGLQPSMADSQVASVPAPGASPWGPPMQLPSFAGPPPTAAGPRPALPRRTLQRLDELVQAVADGGGRVEPWAVGLARSLRSELRALRGDDEEDEDEDGEGSEDAAEGFEGPGAEVDPDFVSFLNSMQGLLDGRVPPGLDAAATAAAVTAAGGAGDDMLAAAAAAAAGMAVPSLSGDLSQDQKKKLASINKVYEQQATTLMIRNLSPNVQTEDFLRLLHTCGFAGAFDLCRVPRDFQTGKGKGMAFVNFRSVQHACLFTSTFQGISGYDIAPATYQGREANVDKWKRRHKNVKDKKMKPWIAG